MKRSPLDSLSFFGRRLLYLGLLQTVATCSGVAWVHAGVVDDYNGKPIISGHSFDSRWQERARMSMDPEIVLGKDWHRSFWAFSPWFAEQLVSLVESRPPQPPYLTVEKLSQGLEAIELRISWDMEQNLYRCSYHLFLSPEVPVSPELESVEGVSTNPKLPTGIGLKQPVPAQAGLAALNVAAVYSVHQMLSFAPMFEAFRRNTFGGTAYVSFHQGTCAALAHSSAEQKLEVGVVIDPKQNYSGITRKNRGRTFAVFSVPSSLIRAGAPYFRRASKINDCYFRERRPPEAIAREPASFRKQRERECTQFRTSPIDFAEKPFDAQE